MRVYLSSTYQDLAAYRNEVLRMLRRAGYSPVAMEDYGADDARPVVRCLADVGACDFYVGIIGQRYGYVDEGYPDAAGRSITELEYRQALSSHIPTLVYLMDESVDPAPGPLEEAGAGQRLRALRAELRREKLAPFFTSPQDLAMQVVADLARKVTEIATTRAGQAAASTSPETLATTEAYRRAQAANPEEEARRDTEVNGLRSIIHEAGKQRWDSDVRVVGTIRDSLVDHFHDRVSQLHQLNQYLADRSKRLVLVCGRGGMGKTTLVTKLIRELRGEPDLQAGRVDSIVFAELRDSQYHSPDRLVDMIARTLSPDAADELRARWKSKGSLAEGLDFLFHQALAQRRCLIVLDNFEDVLDESNHIRDEMSELRQFVEAALEYDHSALLLATSRRSILLTPEIQGRTARRRSLVSLDEGLPPEEAVKLLRDLDEDNEAGCREAPEEVLL